MPAHSIGDHPQTDLWQTQMGIFIVRAHTTNMRCLRKRDRELGGGKRVRS
jgi:hypothetical protein